MSKFIDRRTIDSWEKADLHVHLEGSVPASLLRSIAHRNNISLASPTSFANGQIFPAPQLQGDGAALLENFSDFIRYYVKVTSCLRSTEDIADATRYFAATCEQQSVRRTEVYVTPSTFLHFGWDFSALVAGLKDGQQRAKDCHGVQFAWIFDIVRNLATDGFDTLQLLCRAKAEGVNVIALGLAGDERQANTQQFAEVFQEAGRLGLKRYAHAGETAGPKNIWDTLRFLNPDRIGHGITAVQDAELLKELAERKVPVEVCLCSNQALDANCRTAHPLPQMLAAGLQVVLCSDDPGIFQRDLTDNYLAAAALGISASELEQLAHRSLALSL